MLAKSEAIILRKTPYADNSAIIQIFTKSHGLLSFITQGLHGKSGKAALFQPGNLVEIVFYFQPNKNLKRIKEIRLADKFHGYDSNPVRMQVLIFFLEIMQKSLHEEQEDSHIFEMLQQSLFELVTRTQLTWFPIEFMLRYCEITGLGLQMHSGDKGHIDLNTGDFILTEIFGTQVNKIRQSEIELCRKLLLGETPLLDNLERRNLLTKLVLYLKIHLFPGKEINSLPILTEILEE